MESISKYNMHGIDYVRFDELNALIRAMKKKAMEGEEPGYMEPDEARRRSAMLALNHLEAVLNKERNEARIHERLEKTRQERALKEAGKVIDKAKDALNRVEKAVEAATEEETPGSWMVYKPGDGPKEYWYFVEWRQGKPIIGQCDGMVFTYEGMARHVAGQLGVGWKVIDVSPKSCYEAERLLAAIFREDDEEEE